MPLGVAAALNHAGETIDYMDFVAATGWAFSFGYAYGDISPAFLAVEGNPQADGPFEVFAWLPRQLGYGCEMARTQQPEELWPFVVKHVDTGTPIMSERLDGGLISGYRQQGERRQVYFDGTVGAGWTDIDDLHPYGAYVLVRKVGALPPEKLLREALKRAVKKGRARSAGGTPQGMAALKAYLTDVRDPYKDFAGCEEWFCWAAFERLTARRCAEVWLRRSADALPAKARKPILQAADHYAKAFGRYERYRAEVLAGEPSPLPLRERARTPDRIAAVAAILEAGIAAEQAGLDALAEAVASL